jgi:hypothetical protein
MAAPARTNSSGMCHGFRNEMTTHDSPLLVCAFFA